MKVKSKKKRTTWRERFEMTCSRLGLLQGRSCVFIFPVLLNHFKHSFRHLMKNSRECLKCCKEQTHNSDHMVRYTRDRPVQSVFCRVISSYIYAMLLNVC